MRRHLLNLLTALSLLLCVAVCGLWVRSYLGPDYVHYTSPRQWCLSVISGHGTLDILYIPHWPQDPELTRGRYDANIYYGTRYSKRFLGFGTGVQHTVGRDVNMPHWFLTCCAGVAPARLVRSWRRHRQRSPGLCGRCGYDLRATPGRCPEMFSVL